MKNMKSAENSKNAIKTRIFEDDFERPKGARKISTTAKTKKKALQENHSAGLKAGKIGNGNLGTMQIFRILEGVSLK